MLFRSQRAGLYTFAAIHCMWRGNLVEARRICVLMEADAPPAGAPHTLADISAAQVAGTVAWQLADHEGAVRQLSRGLHLARESGIRVVDNWLHGQLFCAHTSAGDLVAAERDLAAYVPLAGPFRRIDQGQLDCMHAALALYRGRMPEAIDYARRSLRRNEEAGATFGAAVLNTQLGQCLMLDGQHAEARERRGERGRARCTQLERERARGIERDVPLVQVVAGVGHAALHDVHGERIEALVADDDAGHAILAREPRVGA